MKKYVEVEPVARVEGHGEIFLEFEGDRMKDVNFSITERCARPGDVHFGIQVESESELDGVADRLRDAGEKVLDERGATCCETLRGGK